MVPMKRPVMISIHHLNDETLRYLPHHHQSLHVDRVGVPDECVRHVLLLPALKQRSGELVRPSVRRLRCGHVDRSVRSLDGMEVRGDPAATESVGPAHPVCGGCVFLLPDHGLWDLPGAGVSDRVLRALRHRDALLHPLFGPDEGES